MVKNDNGKDDLRVLHLAAVVNKHKLLPVIRCSLAGQSFLCRGSRWNSAHAEINALKFVPYHKLQKKRFCTNLVIYVVRFDVGALKRGSIRLLDSKPCFHCLQTMAKLGIRRVQYSCTNSNELTSASVPRLLRDGDVQVSSGHRAMSRSRSRTTQS